MHPVRQTYAAEWWNDADVGSAQVLANKHIQKFMEYEKVGQCNFSIHKKSKITFTQELFNFAKN